jgi:hypothetical protein
VKVRGLQAELKENVGSMRDQHNPASGEPEQRLMVTPEDITAFIRKASVPT